MKETGKEPEMVLFLSNKMARKAWHRLVDDGSDVMIATFENKKTDISNQIFT